MPAFLARLLRRLTPTTLSAQLAGMLIGGILLLHGVATVTVQRVEERQAARSALLEQANSLALSLQLLHSEPFEYKRSLLERLERLDVVHLSLGDAPNPARQAQDERALYLRDRLRKNLNSIETDLDTREMLTEVQRVHVADSMNPTLRRHVPWTHVYESRVSVRLDDGKWLCVVISSDAYDFSPSQASLAMLLLEAGLLILLILVVVHRMVRPLRVLSGKAESFGRNLYTAPLPEDGPTEVREAARAFNKMQERIRAGVGQHERILAAVAHDLRTPLTSILGYLQLLEDPGLTEGERREYLAVIAGRARTLQSLITSFYDLSRLEGGEYLLQREKVDLYASLSGLLAAFYNDFTDRGFDMEVELAEGLPQVWADAGAVLRIFTNLIRNALEHGEGRMEIRLYQEGGQVVSRFSNETHALTAEDVPHVFDRFFTSDKMRTGRNTGLGLAIVKALAGQMDCRAEAALEGDMFAITLRWPVERR